MVNYGFVAICFAGVWDKGKVVGRKALEESLEGRIRGFCVPIASKDGEGEGSKKVVEFFKGEREVLVFVEV